MKLNETIHGFRPIRVRELDEISAKLWECEYVKNGARLCWLEREDEGENKTFGIGFRTVPTDSTGVFHILEHSVLCGSRKYPVREPFVELIKSSLNTFLNAFTFPDKTVYPVCSRNDKDFLNLMDVYLDAVFYPRALEKPEAFRQEGWHYEFDENGEPILNGVVYNEMKGAYASADDVLGNALNAQLFPDNCYSYDSGGNPAVIPELTYEQYCANHRKFYSPTNSYIFLDGKIDEDAVLGKLDEYLCAFDRIEVDSAIALQKPVHPDELVTDYAVAEGEDLSNKAIVSQGWVFADYSDADKVTACRMLAEVLCGTNQSPLKKAILDADLAEEVELDVMDGVLQPSVNLTLRNIAPEKRAEAWALCERIFREQAEKGIDREQLTAILNRMEFRTRERDFGRFPKGLAFGLSMMDTWLYGGDPAVGLCLDGTFKKLRAGLETDLYEQLLRDVFLDNAHTGRVCMLPSTTKNAENAEEEKARVKAAADRWTEADREQVKAELESLRVFQNTPDTPEQLATIPVLALSDIPEKVAPVKFDVYDVGGVKLLRHPQNTAGILYGDLYFRIDDFSLSELREFSLACELICKLATEKHSALDLATAIMGKLGSFSVGLPYFKDAPYAHVFYSALESQADEVLALVPEIINTTLFDSREQILAVIRQIVMGLEQNVAMLGNYFAAQRVSASFSQAGVVNEAIDGIDYYRWLVGLLADESYDFAAHLSAVCRRAFVRERLTMSIVGGASDEWMEKLAGTIVSAPELVGEKVTYPLRPVSREGIAVPADVGFAVKGCNLKTLGIPYAGSMQVAAQFLTYAYLWNEVRVTGGAYGTGLSVGREGGVAFTSYRDPQAARSLGIYDHCGEVLRSFCASGEDLTKFIISTISNTDPLLTAKSSAARANLVYFSGYPLDVYQQLRQEILHTSADDLLAAADMLDAACAGAGVCVVGGKAVLEACGDLLDSIEPLKK